MTAVRLNGVALELEGVLADVVIRHGRARVDDGPTASTVQLTLLGVTHAFSSSFRVGVPLQVDADGATRFVGTITDATLDEAALTVIAAGPLSTLSRHFVGAVDWPAEAWHLRVQRAFAEAGLAALLLLEFDADFDPVLVARLADPVDLRSYLQTLADDIGAAVADTPDGRVLVQELSARSQDAALTWETTPATIAWNECDPGCSWAEATSAAALDPSTPSPLPVLLVDPADVLYVPPWEMVDEVENVTTIEYGAGLQVTVTEAASVALFDHRPGGVSTRIAGLADATQRATDRVGRRAFPRWVISSVALLRGYPGLTLGQVVELTGFPPSSPFHSWAPILEGWTDTINGDVWNTELAVSDALLSGVVLTWATTPPDIAWVDVDPACSWAEATDIGSLNPALEEVH